MNDNEMMKSISDDLFLIKRELGLIPSSPRDWDAEEEVRMVRDWDEDRELRTPFQLYEYYKGDIKELVLWQIESEEYIMNLAKERDAKLHKSGYDGTPSLKRYAEYMYDQKQKEIKELTEMLTDGKLSKQEILKGMYDQFKMLQADRTIARSVIRDYADKIIRYNALVQRIAERHSQGEKDLLGADWKPERFSASWNV